jgi:hypothetical protein
MMEGLPLRQMIKEGLSLAQQLAALPFKTARGALRETPLKERPLGDVLDDSFALGEGLARLPFRATAAIMDEIVERRPTIDTLEAKVAELERRLGLEQSIREKEPGPPPSGT